MLCTQEEAEILDEFIKHLVTTVTDLLQESDQIKQWTTLLEMSKSELYCEFNAFMQSSHSMEYNDASKARWGNLFQDNGFIGALQDKRVSADSVKLQQISGKECLRMGTRFVFSIHFIMEKCRSALLFLAGIRRTSLKYRRAGITRQPIP